MWFQPTLHTRVEIDKWAGNFAITFRSSQFRNFDFKFGNSFRVCILTTKPQIYTNQRDEGTSMSAIA